MILVRYILIVLIVYLIVRSFTKYRSGAGSSANGNVSDKSSKPAVKKISKEIGEYVDYEEVKK